METKRYFSTPFIKIVSIISAIALAAVATVFYFFSDELSIFTYVKEIFSGYANQVDFGGLLYTAAAGFLIAIFLIGSIISLFIRNKNRLKTFYRIYTCICGFIALIAMLVEGLFLQDSASYWKNVLLSFSAIAFFIVWINVAIGCVMHSARKARVIGAIKALLLLFGASSLFFLFSPLFEGNALTAKSALSNIQYSLFPAGGNTDFFASLLSNWAKNSVFQTIAPIFYTIAVALPLCNLLLTQLTVFSHKTRAFDLVRYTIAFTAVCLAFSAPALLFNNVKPALSLYYGVTALSLLLGIILSAFISPQTETQSAWKDPSIFGTPVNEEVEQEDCEQIGEQASFVKLSQEEFEIGKQISLDQEDDVTETIKTTFVSEGIDATDYQATATTMPALESDAFIASLTIAERMEFRKFFIDADAPESSHLPRYFVGGDNRLFFKRVFVFIAQFRSQVSPSLIEKIYMQAIDLMD